MSQILKYFHATNTLLPIAIVGDMTSTMVPIFSLRNVSMTLLQDFLSSALRAFRTMAWRRAKLICYGRCMSCTRCIGCMCLCSSVMFVMFVCVCVFVNTGIKAVSDSMVLQGWAKCPTETMKFTDPWILETLLQGLKFSKTWALKNLAPGIECLVVCVILTRWSEPIAVEPRPPSCFQVLQVSNTKR